MALKFTTLYGEIPEGSIKKEKLSNDLAKSFYEEYERIEMTKETGYMKKDGSVDTSTWWHSTGEVKEGEIIFFSTRFAGFTYHPNIIFKNEAGIVIEYWSATKEFVNNKRYIVPKGATQVIINTSDNSYIPYVLTIKCQKTIDKDLSIELYKKFKVEYKTYNNYIQLDNYRFNAQGNFESDSAFKFIFVSVKEGEKYNFSTYNGNGYTYILCDSLGNVVESSGSLTDWKIYKYELTIPSGVTQLIFNIRPGYDWYLQKLEIVNDFDKKNWEQRIIDEQLKNDFKWKSFSGTKFATFTFDDSLSDIDIIENLFERKGVPCCFATIPSKLDNICINGESVRQVLNRAVANGGEVLTHGETQLSSSSTDEDYIDHYVGNKQKLEENGFVINGIITVGGDKYKTQDFTKSTLVARPYYQYGDLTSETNSSIEQYFNMRKFLDSGYDDVKLYIDKYITNGSTQGFSKWMNFASHGTKDTSIEVIEQILDYCISQGVQIVTWKYVYDNFKSSKLEERIKALES